MVRRASLPQSGNEAADTTESRPMMTRGVSQLLFNYLPERTVDWEDGLAIVRLGGVRLSAPVWPQDRARVVFEEIGHQITRWRLQGGTVDPEFPDPVRNPGRFTVGTPESIEAMVLQTAYICRQCNAFQFPSHADLANAQRPLRCTGCGSSSLRQFGQVFVHGCGELIPVKEYIPGIRYDENRIIEAIDRPIRCERCGRDAVLEMPPHSERVSEMKIRCRQCQAVVVERLTANCPRCAVRIAREQREEGGVTGGVSPIARMAMRLSRYSASDTYYPMTVTLLRLDRPELITTEDSSLQELRSLLPLNLRPEEESNPVAIFAALNARLQRAYEIGDTAEQEHILTRIAAVATGTTHENTGGPQESPPDTEPDIIKAIQESIAFRKTVNTRPALALARQSDAGQLLGERIGELQRRLGLAEIALVDDLPVITSTFGYTRRSFEPTYEELGTCLPTEIRMFPALDRFAANSLGRQDLMGTIPILAREGEHQGIFVSLDPMRVIRWLARNGVDLPDGLPPITRILTALEPIDRYYDEIWQCQTRRMVFGLIHTLSHVVMRATSLFAGLERTSLSEYLFLPLLGTVVFDTSGGFQLGGIEALVRNHLAAFLEQLPADALTCIYDTDCIDGRGACHGCVHSPEIACRVFNHGLSRAFLLGGHVPWLDVSDDRQIIGFWQEDT